MNDAPTTSLETAFDDAVAHTREALSWHGFGVLAEIDVQATLKNKRDEAMKPQLLVDVTDEAELQPIAQEVADKLEAVIATLAA